MALWELQGREMTDIGRLKSANKRLRKDLKLAIRIARNERDKWNYVKFCNDPSHRSGDGR